MKISLYVKKSDAYQQLESVLAELKLPYELRFKEDYPDDARRIGATESPLLVVDGRCTFLSSHLASEELRLLLQSCTELPENVQALVGEQDV